VQMRRSLPTQDIIGKDWEKKRDKKKSGSPQNMQAYRNVGTAGDGQMDANWPERSRDQTAD